MPDFNRHVPLGIDAKREIKWCLIALCCAAVFSLGFVFRCASARSQLFRYTIMGTHELREGAVMPDFVDLLGSSLLGFAVLCLAMAGLAVFHYAWHRTGSRSIYLMRRLPKRTELHRRCLALPLCCCAAAVIAAFLLICVYYLLYLALTPEGCLAPGQWALIWRWF